MTNSARGEGLRTIFSFFLMVVSLVRAGQLPAISNGLLLGGVLTMLCGVGWIVATDPSVGRFLVMTAALAITPGLGHVRFVRRSATSSAAGGAAAPHGEEVAELERRVRDLEARLNDAAQALGHGRDGSGAS